jgi:tetratricopeptide (TPR) repeat protein
MGVMYRRMGKPEKAIEAFEKAMAVDPRHEISRYNKGIVLLHDLNNVEGAIKAWEDLIRVNPAYMAPTGQTVKQMVDVYKGRREKESGGVGKTQ